MAGVEGSKKIKELASRRRLAFKHLTETLDQLGLSYRKGAMLSKAGNANAAFLISPPYFLVDEGLRMVWEKCEESFFANYAQLALFRRQLETPAKVQCTLIIFDLIEFLIFEFFHQLKNAT